MGTLPTKFYYNNDIEEKLITETNNILYIYECTIKNSSLDYIKTTDKYKLYLCENDIILESKLNKYIFIYQNIKSWIFSKNTFGFFLKTDNKSICTDKFIVLNVINGTEIADNLKNITTDLVKYYKDL
jgi:hypothetical protein